MASTYRFFAAPLVPGVLLFLCSIWMDHGPYWENSAMLALWLPPLLGFPIAIFPGIPLIIMMERYKLYNYVYFLITGLFTGLLAVGFFCLYSGQPAPQIVWFGWGGIMGIVAASAFWLIAKPYERGP
jgi:hypothetical protein